MSTTLPGVYQADSFDFSGYSMPAEWHPHDATWLVWPVNIETWPEHMEEARQVYVQMIEALTPHERVYLLIGTCENAEEIRGRLAASKANMANLKICNIPVNDSWVRDAGPIFVKTTQPGKAPLLAHDFIFNMWGDKYRPYDQDDLIPEHAAALLQVPCVKHSMVLEGGSIDVNGNGTLLTTRQCLLNPNRNPALTQKQIEDNLKKYLGVQQVLWLEEGIDGDDTDGHVDDISRFVNSRTIVTAVEANKNDANYGPLRLNLEKLTTFRDLDGRPFDVIELPMPERMLHGPFGRSPASYANFYIANNTVLVPIYSAPNDQEALDILKKCFPDRNVIGIECTALVNGLGSIHCVTQQQPRL
ncbi:MAG: agmatine deiminase family protein [Methylacidiphilales bacterium]|nr:agmatine deiminase family protein [Candidatus Methylacidiphilales bacterium]